MKRFISCVLTLVLVLGMIPASMLSALARGRGVYYSDTENQSLINANGQYIPETIKVDGILDDTGWPASGFSYVDKNTGLWNTADVPSDAIADYLNYRYQIRADYDHLYVGASVTVPENTDNAKFTVMFKDRSLTEESVTIALTGAEKNQDGMIIMKSDWNGNEWWQRYAFAPVAGKENCFKLVNELDNDEGKKDFACPENGFILAIHNDELADQTGKANQTEVDAVEKILLNQEVYFDKDPVALAGTTEEFTLTYYPAKRSDAQSFRVTEFLTSGDLTEDQQTALFGNGHATIITNGTYYKKKPYRFHVAFAPVSAKDNVYRIVAIHDGLDDDNDNPSVPLTIPSGGFVWLAHTDGTAENLGTPAIADAKNWHVGMTFDFGNFNPMNASSDASAATYKVLQDGYTQKIVFNLSGNNVTVDNESLVKVLLTDETVKEYTLPMHWALESKKDGNTYTFEFRNMLLDTFGGQRDLSDISYFVSADIGDISLIHPIAAVDNMDYTVNNFDDGAFLVEVPTSEFWPLASGENGTTVDAGGTISKLDSNKKYPNSINIDGKFDEESWGTVNDYVLSGDNDYLYGAVKNPNSFNLNINLPLNGASAPSGDYSERNFTATSSNARIYYNDEYYNNYDVLCDNNGYPGDEDFKHPEYFCAWGGEHSGATEVPIVLKFKKSQNTNMFVVNKIEVHVYANSGAGISKPNNYAVQYSYDGVHFYDTAITSQTESATSKTNITKKTLNIDEVAARYIKLIVYPGGGDNRFFFCGEIDVAGKRTYVMPAITYSSGKMRLNGKEIANADCAEVDGNLEFRIPWSALGMKPNLSPAETDEFFSYTVNSGAKQKFTYAKMIKDIVVDGKFEESIWLDGMTHVNSDEGTWANKSTYDDVSIHDSTSTGNGKDPEKPQNNIVFDYDYKLYTSDNYLYGAARIDADGKTNGTEFNLWINNGIDEYNWLRDNTPSTNPVDYNQPTYRAENIGPCYPNKEYILGKDDAYLCNGNGECQEDGKHTYGGEEVDVVAANTKCEGAGTHYISYNSEKKEHSWQLYYKIREDEKETKYYRNYNYKISLDENGVAKGEATPNEYYTDGSESHTVTIDDSNFKYAMKTINGITYVEFVIDLANFGCENKDDLKYFVSVSNKYEESETLSLYHPQIPDSHIFWINGADRTTRYGHSGMGVIFTGNGTTTHGGENAYINVNTVYGYGACTQVIFEKQGNGVYKIVDICKLASIGNSYNLKIGENQFAYVVHTGREMSFEKIEASWESVFMYFEAMSWNVGDEFMFNGVEIEDLLDAKVSYKDFIPALNLNINVNDIGEDPTDDNGAYFCTARLVRIKNGDLTNGYINGTHIKRSPLEQSWDTNNAGTIAPLVHFAPEVITVDGIINDIGWANEDLWIDVDHGINATSKDEADSVDFGYSFALRTDADYLYVAAELGTSFWEGVSFRLWLNGNGGDKYSHLYDLKWDNGEAYLEITDLPKEMYDWAEGADNTYLGYKHPNDDQGYVTYADNALRFGKEFGKYALSFESYSKLDEESKYGASALYGYTEQIQENQTSGEFYPTIKTEKIYLGKQAGVIRNADENKTVVEFRVKLEEFGAKVVVGEDVTYHDFEYYTQASTRDVTLIYPACEIDASSGRDTNMPQTAWNNDTAAKVTAADMKDGLIKLRNNCMPVVTLGVKINEHYDTVDENGKPVLDQQAIRFGALYNEDYIRNFVDKDKNRLPNKNDPMYTDEMLDYWDVADVGIIYIPTQLLGTEENKDPNGVTLTHDTDRAQWDSAINIVDWVHETSDSWSNYADYENFSFYVTIYNMPTDVRFSFRSYVDFYHSTGVDVYYGETLVRSFDGVADSNMPKDDDSGVTEGGDTYPDIDPGTQPEPEPTPAPPTVYNISAESGTGMWWDSDITDDFSYSYQYEVVDGNFVLSVTVNDDELVPTPESDNTGNGNGTNVRLWVNYGSATWDRLYDGFVKSNGAKIYSKTPSGDASTTGTVDLTGKTFTFTIPFSEISNGNDEFQFIVCVSNKVSENSNAALYPYYLWKPTEDWDETSAHTVDQKPATTLPIVAYIPLDDRPVNYDRVKYLVGSAGFELVMPHEDLFSTRLSNPGGKVGTATLQDKCGEPEALYAWLQNVEADYYVISLDQILSGGLVNSRANPDLNLDWEEDVIDYIVELAQTEKVYLLDTVMRLASTDGYGDYSSDAYGDLRKVYAVEGRPVLAGDELNVENIIINYEYDENGDKITVPNTITSILPNYLAARERKLKIADYLLTKDGVENIQHIYFAVDDSSPKNTIQTNEINYIKKLGTGDKFTYSLFAGTDELGLTAVGAVASDKYMNNETPVNLTYFGSGEDQPADEYDTGSLDTTVKAHIVGAGGKLYESSDSSYLQILVRTKNANDAQMDQLVSTLKSNLENNIPTCVIDALGDNGGHTDLANKILNAGITDIAKLYGYSQWNTVSNAVGISIGSAVGRYAYIQHVSNKGKTSTEEANEAFVKNITTMFVKDIAYVAVRTTQINVNNWSTVFTSRANTILTKINGSEMMISNTQTETIGTVSVDAPVHPWSRLFELRFTVTVN
ncbi:MAG: DUF4127 family protein [Ruminococcaceae bacterium]|nr:DUF4127 family protein [Oscillospiraceae bacterium]